jgi:hydrogenase maturation protein HypF
VIVERLPDDEARVTVADEVAPGSRRLGVLLPTTPLHRLLAAGAARPLVCTSGNLAGEPICIDDAEARARLAGVADLFLGHERRIVRPVDDSVARVGPAGLVLLRRARGFAPLPLAVDGIPAGIVALGAQLKSTVAVSLDGEVVVSQHLGDLHSADAAALLEWTVGDLLGLFALRPRLVACDLHPDYASTRLAERLTSRWQVPLVRVQHHHAHVAACVAEHGVRAPLGPVGPVIPVLGLAWDGAGLGGDGMLWGGEALLVDGAHFRRVAHLRPFSLPGGERAMREPRRSALGLLHAISAEDAAAWSARRFAPADARVLLAMLARGLGTPTTSVGRLFDAVAALAGVRDVASFEGQAAMELEELADEVAGEASAGPGRARIEPYPLPLRAGARGEPAVADWEPLVREVVHDLARGVPSSVVAARFHASLGELAAAIALRACVPRVALAGGCFQNVRLAREVRARLEARGFEVLSPRVHPPNDAAIALGQVVVAAARERKEEDRVSRDPG